MTLPVTIALLAVWSVAMFRYGRSVLFPPASWPSSGRSHSLPSGCAEICITPLPPRPMKSCSPAFSPSLSEESAPSLFPYGRGEHSPRSPEAAHPGRPMADHRGDSLPAEYPLLLPVFQTTQRNHCPARKYVETNPHRLQQGKHIRPQALPLESFILPLLSIVALIAVYEYADTGRRRVRTLFLVLLAAGYQLLNGARSEVLLLLISSVVILWLKRGRRAHPPAGVSWALYFCWSSPPARSPWANMARIREHR